MNVLNALKRNWNGLVVFAAALSMGFARFVDEPFAAGSLFAYARFLVAVGLGLWFVPMHWYRRHAHARRWLIVAGLLFVLSAVGVPLYNSYLDRWTVVYYGDERSVIGTTLTDDAASYRMEEGRSGPPLSDLRLLQHYGGDAKAVWAEAEISFRANALVGMYLVTLLVLAGAAITVSQAIYCVVPRPRKQ